MNELALFAGAGGGILGGILNGWRTVCAVEINDYCRRVLMQRQDDGILEPFPIWSDVTTFDGRPWNGCVDIVTGGFPCQDISAAGKGAGITGERSGLWKEMARIIGEVRPSYVLVENSPMLTSRGLGTVLGDLSSLGFDAEWGVISAENAGAPHQRERAFILAHTKGSGRQGSNKRRSCAKGKESRTFAKFAGSGSGSGGWWATEPGMGRVVDWVPDRVDRIRSVGNAQVPAVVALAWQILSGGARPGNQSTNSEA